MRVFIAFFVLFLLNGCLSLETSPKENVQDVVRRDVLQKLGSNSFRHGDGILPPVPTPAATDSPVSNDESSAGSNSFRGASSESVVVAPNNLSPESSRVAVEKILAVRAAATSSSTDNNTGVTEKTQNSAASTTSTAAATTTTSASTTTTSTTTTTTATTSPTPSTSSSKGSSTTTLGPDTSPALATSSPSTSSRWEVVAVFGVFRGGIRTPFAGLPGAHEDWRPYGHFGRLTRAGAQQMQEYGRMLADFYSDIVPDAIFSTSAVSIRATDHIWSVMSARSVMEGMFPATWLEKDRIPQVFPIHVNVDEDDLLLLAPRNCPVYHFELQQQLHQPTNPAWAKVVASAQPILDHLRGMYGSVLDPALISLESWDVFYDPAECYVANGLQLPFNFSQDQMRSILQIGDAIEKINYPPNYGGLLGGNFMSHVLDLMKNALERNIKNAPKWERQPRLFLFSGHRETLSALLSVLGQTLEHAPGFGEHIELELLRDSSQKAFVRARHNSAKGLLKVCVNSTQDNLCPFEQFVLEMKSKMAQDWGLRCERADTIRCLESQKEDDSTSDILVTVTSPINGLWYVVSGAAGLLVICVAILVFWKWKYRPQEGDVPEEVPMKPLPKRGPKKFTLE